MELERGFVQLNSENYLRWKFEIETILEARDCSDLVSGETLCSAVGDEKVSPEEEGCYRQANRLTVTR
ncbi:hypothetical protein TTRE_0000828901 [Trichuris trichiura]|uniref:DUF4219 domain-containing protein n=1 Tax=Trichuris trichiura TaxID=36087 RepID=A0A077ZHR8_TRITR|nr:hypothetical protein TTRE_0000828901 [Trichuris trichiura]